MKGLEKLTYEERLRVLGLLCLEKRRLGRVGNTTLTTVFQYLKSSYKEDRGSLFRRSHIKKTRSNRYKLHWERFCLDIRKIYSKNNHLLEKPPQECGEVPITEGFQNAIGQGAKSHLDSISHKRLDQIFLSPSQPGLFYGSISLPLFFSMSPTSFI